MSQPANSPDALRQLMDLRCRKEILERWLASDALTGGVRQSLRVALGEVDEQLQVLSGIFEIVGQELN